MKLKFFLLVLFNFSFAVNINFLSDINISKSLKNNFISYWDLRSEKKFNNTYKYELPYLQYIYTKKWYKMFFKSSPVIKKIVVKRINCNKTKCKIGMLLITKNNTKMFYYDLWIKVDNIWYHRFRDRILPF